MAEIAVSPFQIEKTEKLKKLEHLTFKIVGFKIGVDKAVYYKALRLPDDVEFGKHMNFAFHEKECDFVSVRRI